MLELLAYLRANGFKTYIVSGGGVEFMRPWTEKVYGIPPEQVVGSSGVVKFETGADGKPVLMKLAKNEFVDDGPGKPVGINRFIGRRPIFAFGNSDGDLQMLQWTVAGSGARFAGLVHHTDAEREYAYDRNSKIGKLDKALDEANAKGWTVVDMKRDWKTVFPEESKRPDNVHKVQNGLKLRSLDRWGKNPSQPDNSAVDASVDTRTPPLVSVGKMTGVELFDRFAELMKEFPPHPNDYPILFRMKAIGLEPGHGWDRSKLDQATLDAINAGAREGQQEMIAGIKTIGSHKNGWSTIVDNTGTYGTSYRQRAIIALGGLGANLPADAIYPTAFSDSEGKLLDGANRYALHFDKGKTPPANAFWSITMYDNEGFQVSNPINRFAIGDRDKLKYNEDGSLDIYVQSETPGKDKEANWLPSPRSGAMGPTLRIYAPRVEALDGSWSPPPFEQAR